MGDAYRKNRVGNEKQTLELGNNKARFEIQLCQCLPIYLGVDRILVSCEGQKWGARIKKWGEEGRTLELSLSKISF